MGLTYGEGVLECGEIWEMLPIGCPFKDLKPNNRKKRSHRIGLKKIGKITQKQPTKKEGKR